MPTMDELEDRRTTEFNRTHAGMNELIHAERRNLDIVDECEPKPLDGHFFDWNAEGLSEKHVWLQGELMRLYNGGFEGGVNLFRELASFMAKMSQLNADISFCGPNIEVSFFSTKITLVHKCRITPHA